MTRKVRKQPTGFTQVTNLVLNDTTLSWKAKGIYAYIFSKPDGWDFSARRIARDAKDGNDGTISGIRELEEAGYIRRERQGDGRVTYHILVDPNTEKPEVGTLDPNTENPKEGKAHLGKTRTVSNKELEVIKSSSNKEIVLHQFYGELNNVELLPEEHQKLTEKLGAETLAELIEDLSLYIPNKPGKKYSSHYAVLTTWARKRSKEGVRGRKTFSLIG